MSLKLRNIILEAAGEAAPAPAQDTDNRAQYFIDLFERQKNSLVIFDKMTHLTARQKITLIKWFCQKASIPTEVLTIAVSKMKQTR